MSDIVISEFMDQAAVDDLASSYDVHYDPDLVDHPADLMALLSDSRALIVRNRTQVREAILKAGPHLCAIGRLGVGLDNIDLDACRARNIEVLPATGANDEAVAEYVIAVALVLVRGSYLSTNAMIQGRWPRQALIGYEVQGRTMGLVGFGAIARQVARRALAMGMKIAACDPFIPADDPAWQGIQRHEDLISLLAVADTVSLHMPLTNGTRGLFGAETIALMKPGAVLINTARGGIVDEPAVAQALRDGRLRGAAMDVFAAEPLTGVTAGVFDGLPNVILTPHIAGVTEESNVRVSGVTVANVRRVLEKST